MGDDDDEDCPAHVWVLDEVVLEVDGSWSTYRCLSCEGVLAVAPGGVHPRGAT